LTALSGTAWLEFFFAPDDDIGTAFAIDGITIANLLSGLSLLLIGAFFKPQIRHRDKAMLQPVVRLMTAVFAVSPSVAVMLANSYLITFAPVWYSGVTGMGVVCLVAELSIHRIARLNTASTVVKGAVIPVELALLTIVRYTTGIIPGPESWVVMFLSVACVAYSVWPSIEKRIESFIDGLERFC
jgi:hypothetical protein